MLLLISEIKLLSHHKNLLWQMVSREIKARYKQSILGYFWVILNPLAQMLVMSFAFSLIMRIPTAANDKIPYSLFLFTALLPWNLFSTSLASASNSLVSNSSLITKIYFPRTILVLSTIVAKIIDFLFANIILIVYLIIYKIPLTPNILWVIPIFLIQQIFTLGISFFLSAANLMYRDIQYLLSLVLILWMYLTPVIYPVDIVPARFRFIYQLNPMSVIINAYRQSILSGAPPKFSSLAIALFVSLIVLLFGLHYFKREEKTFTENV
jgi:ABC-type polysaccharide/polyol phosphate export permease